MEGIRIPFGLELAPESRKVIDLLVADVEYLERQITTLPPIRFAVDDAELTDARATILELARLADKPLDLRVDSVGAERLTLPKDTSIEVAIDPDIDKLQTALRDTDVLVDVEVDPDVAKLNEALKDTDVHVGVDVDPDVSKLNASLKDTNVQIGVEVDPDIDKINAALKDQSVVIDAAVDPDIERLRGVVAGLEKELSNKLILNADGSNVEQLLDRVLADANQLEGEFNAVKAAAQFDGVRKELQSLLSVQEKALATLRATGKTGSAEYQHLQAEIAKTRAEINKLDKAQADVGKGAGGAGKFQEALGGIGQKLNQVVGFVPQLGGLSSGLNAAATSGLKMAAALGGVAAIALGLRAVISVGQEFEDSLRDMQAIIGSTDEETQALGDRARELGLKFGIEGKEGVETFKLVIGALGPEVAEDQAALQSMADTVLTFAKAGGLEGAEATKALTVTLSQFGFASLDAAGKAEKMAEISNIMAAAAQEGAAEIPDLSESMKVAGATANAAGLSVAETAAALELLAPAGIKGAEAGTALRNMLLKMSTGSAEGAKELAKLGLTFNDINPKAVGFEQGLAKLQKGFESIQDPVEQATLLKRLFGLENANAATLLLKNGDALDTFTSKVSNTNTAQEQAQLKMSTFSEEIKRLAVQIQDIGITIFEAIRPALSVFTGLASAVFSVVGPIASFAAKNATLLTVVGSTVAVLLKWNSIVGGMAKMGTQFVVFLTKQIASMVGSAAATTADTGAKIANTAATGVATGATVGFGTALKALFATMLANPIFLVTAGLVALGAGLAALLSSGESVEEALEGFNEEMANTQKAIGDTAESDKAQDSLLGLADKYDALKAKQQELQATIAAAGEGSEAGIKATEELKKVNDDLAATADIIAEKMPAATGSIVAYGEGAKGAASGPEVMTDVLRDFAGAQKETNDAIREGAFAKLSEESSDLANAVSEAKEEVEDLNAKKKDLVKQLADIKAADPYPGQAYAAEALREKIRDVTIEIGEQTAQQAEGEQKLRDAVKLAFDQKKSFAEIKEMLGGNAQLAAKYTQEIWEATRASFNAARNQDGLQQGTKLSADRAAELAKQWEEISSSAEESVNQSLNAVAALILARKKGEAQEGDAEAEAELRTQLEGQVKELKLIQKIIEDLKKQYGLTSEKARKSIRSISAVTADLTDIFRTAQREIQNLTAKVEIGAIETPFAKLAAQFDEDKRLIEQSIKDTEAKAEEALTKALADQKAKQEDENRKAKEEKRGALTVPLEFKLEVDGKEFVATTKEEAEKLVQQTKEKVKELEAVQILQLNQGLVKEEKKLGEELAKERLGALEGMLKKERDLVKERYTFELEFVDETTVSGLEQASEKRLRLLEIERDETIRTAVESLPAYQEADKKIVETLRDRIIETRKLVQAGTLTETEAQTKIEEFEREALTERAKTRERLVVDERKREGSQVFQIFRYYTDKETAEIQKLDAAIRDLGTAYDPFIEATKQATETLKLAWQKYYESLDELRNEDARKAEEQKSEDIAKLERDLREGTIKYEDYTRQLAQIRNKDSESEGEESKKKKGFIRDFGAVLAEVSVEQVRTRSEQIRSLEDIADATDFAKENIRNLEAAAQVGAAGVITAFTGLAVEGGKQARDFGIVFLDVIASLLDKAIPALIALIWGKAFAENPLTGGLLAAGITAVLLGLVAAGKSALASKEEGGYAGDGGKSEPKGIYHGGEFIHTKEATRENRELFEWIHAKKDPMDWFVNEAGQLVGRQRETLLFKLFDGIDPIEWMIAESTKAFTGTKRATARSIMREASHGGDVFDLVVRDYHREILPLLEQYRVELPGIPFEDREASERLMTNQDGSAFNHREVVRAIDRQTGAIEKGNEKLSKDFSEVKQHFKDSRSVELSGTLTADGDDMSAMITSKNRRGLSS